MSVVVDASLVIALLVFDPQQDAVITRVRGWMEIGEKLHAPAVLPYEVANVLARRAFDGNLTMTEVTEVWTDLAALNLVLHPFEPRVDGPQIAVVTAQLRRRHATDSSYVCLAIQLGTSMWTLDGTLARNAADVGLPVELVA